MNSGRRDRSGVDMSGEKDKRGYRGSESSTVQDTWLECPDTRGSDPRPWAGTLEAGRMQDTEWPAGEGSGLIFFHVAFILHSLQW